MAKFEAFVKNFFSYNSKTLSNAKHHENMITFLRRNDYFFKKEY